MKTKKLLFACGLVSAMAFTSNAFAISEQTLNVYQLSADVTVDGTLDAAWETIPALPIVLDGTATEVTPSEDYTATVRTAWRGTKLYFFISILDNEQVFLRGGQGYGVQDNVNIYLNFATDFATAEAYTGSTHQYRINIKDDEDAEQFDGRYAGNWDYSGLAAEGKELVTKVVTGGYTIETSLDLATAWNYAPAAITAEEQFAVGFEAADIDAGAEAHKLYWSAGGNSWDVPTALGTATFKAANGPTGISTTKNDQISLIKNAENEVVILSKPNMAYQVYDVLGKKRFEGITNSNKTVVKGLLTNSLYIFKVGNAVQKIIL